MLSCQSTKYMCDYCERSFSEAEYDNRQTVCECGHLIMSQFHVLPMQVSKSRLTKKQSASGTKCAKPDLARYVAAFHSAGVGVELAAPFVRCVGKQKPKIAPSPNAFPDQVAVDFCFGKITKSRGNQLELAAVGKQSAPHVAVYAPSIRPAMVTNVAACQTRCRRKSRPSGAYPNSPLLVSSVKEAGSCAKVSARLFDEVEDRQARHSSPKKRSIDQVGAAMEDSRVKKPRRFCAGGA